VTTPYVLATPVKDELAILPELLADLEAQQARPGLWLVVDDGSSDGSTEWLAARASERDWMELRSAPEAAREYLGGHIARIKRWGLEQAFELADQRGLDPQVGGVLDADVRLPSDHYARILAAFADDPSLGVASSVMCIRQGDSLVPEALQREDLPRGPTQTFRRACLDAIGGLPPYPGFDGAANALAGLRGWTRRLLVDLRAEHRRPTATRYGTREGYARKGRYAWFLGHHPLVVLGRAAAFTLNPPHAGGLHFLAAWVKDAASGAERCPDRELRSYFGKQRLRESVRAVLGRGPGFVSSPTLPEAELAGPAMRDRVGLAIFALGVVAHALLLLAMGPHHVLSYRLDANVYLELARNLWFEGEYGSVIGNTYPPLYPMLLAPLFAVGDNSLRFILIYCLHGLILGLASLSLMPMLRSAMSLRRAWITLALVQLVAGTTIHAIFTRSEILFTALILVATGAAYAFARAPSFLRALALGAVCSLALATRRTGLALPFALTILLAVEVHRRWRSGDGVDAKPVLGAALGLALGLLPEGLAILMAGESLGTYSDGVVGSHLKAGVRSFRGVEELFLALRVAARHVAYACLSTLALPVLMIAVLTSPSRERISHAARQTVAFVLSILLALIGMSTLHIVRYWQKNDMERGFDLYPRYIDPAEPSMILVGLAVACLAARAFQSPQERAQLTARWWWFALGCALLSWTMRRTRGYRLPSQTALDKMNLGPVGPWLFLVGTLVVLALFRWLWRSGRLHHVGVAVLVVVMSWTISAHIPHNWKRERKSGQLARSVFGLDALQSSPRAPIAVPVVAPSSRRVYYSFAFRSDHDIRFLHPSELNSWMEEHPTGFVLTRDDELQLPWSPSGTSGQWTIYPSAPDGLP
jgi:hypothetical protein